MSVNSYVLVTIPLGSVVPQVPRVAPFILVKYKGLPEVVIRFLKYLSVSILFALTFSNLFGVEIRHLSQIEDLEVPASLPTFYVALKSKNLLYTVITGIVSMAILRLIF